MEWWIYPVVVLAGAVAGFINTLAGSGSLLTLPLLIFLGLPANMANGTNRVGILLQSLVAVGRFKQKKVFDWSDGVWLTVPAGVGALIGAWVAVDLNEQLMNLVIGGLLVFMFFLILLKPERWIGDNKSHNPIRITPLRILVFLLIGFYGGFIQAGVGFFLLAGLVLGAGMDLLKSNAVKVLITLVFTVLALGVFVANNQVDFKLGVIMGLGNMMGAWIATHVAVKRGAKFIRGFLLAVILVFAVKLLIW